MRPYASAKQTDSGVPLEFDTAGMTVSTGDAVILSTSSGERYATVVPDVPSSCGGCVGCALKTHPPKLVRLATEEDRGLQEQKLLRETEAYRSCSMKITERGLAMKLISVAYEMDGNHATFFYTAEGRIDFRSLVRELAREFRTRIEMRQIGARDAAAHFGGYGTCGRPLCCSTWLTRFRPISVKMAKDQNLSLNPSRLTGQCGRLKCCLAYELPPSRHPIP